MGKELLQKIIIPKYALVGSLKLTKIEHIANTRKLQYYVDLQNRDKNKLEVKMQKLQQSKNMSYEKEIKEKYEINGVQTYYLTKLLNVPSTTPKCALVHS